MIPYIPDGRRIFAIGFTSMPLARYTRAHLPIELFYYESFADKRSAMRREYEIKRLTRAEKMKLCEKERLVKAMPANEAI